MRGPVAVAVARLDFVFVCGVSTAVALPNALPLCVNSEAALYNNNNAMHSLTDRHVVLYLATCSFGWANVRAGYKVMLTARASFLQNMNSFLPVLSTVLDLSDWIVTSNLTDSVPL